MTVRQFKRKTAVEDVADDSKYHAANAVFQYSDALPKASSYFNHDFYRTDVEDPTIDYIDFCITEFEAPVSYTGRTNHRPAGHRSVDYPYLRSFAKTSFSGGDGFDNPNMFKTHTEQNATFDKNGKYGLIVESCHLNWVEKANGAAQELSAIYQSKDSKANESIDTFRKMILAFYKTFDVDNGKYTEIKDDDLKYLWKLIDEINPLPSNMLLIKEDVYQFFWTYAYMSTYTNKAWVMSSKPDCTKYPDCTACLPPPDINRKPGPA